MHMHMHWESIVNEAFGGDAPAFRMCTPKLDHNSITVAQVVEVVVTRTILLLQKVYHFPTDSYFHLTSRLSSHPSLGS